MPEPSDLDRGAVRRQFDRRVAVPDPAAFLLREIEARMLERLDLVRLAPTRVLDVGCGLGDGVRRLRQRWPQAEVLGVDLAPRRLAVAAAIEQPPAAGGWVRRLLAPRRGGAAGRAAAPAAPLGRYVAGDAHRLPVASHAIDLVWSNLVLHWLDDVPAAIAEWYRVIRPGGLLMFSALGVDTLIELRRAGALLPALPDMHDLGDALAAAGFAEPVMDTERLTVTWSDPARLLAELRGLGGDARRARRRGLATPRQRARALASLEGRLRGDPPATAMPVTFEVVYGHAWCGSAKRRTDGYSPVEFRRPPGRGLA
jgi:malonyl-CoA O-methyltransferase